MNDYASNSSRGNLATILSTAMLDFSNGDNLKAYGGFLVALRVRPNNTQALYMLSEACIRLGASELAAGYSRAALAVDPEIKAALLVQIEAATRQNDLDKANALMRELPSDGAYQFMHALITQRLALAANEFEAPLVDLANIIESTGKQELARELFTVGFSRFLNEQHQERYDDFIEALGLRLPPQLSLDIHASLDEPAAETIDIIIPVHNSVHDLAECLSSLQRCSDPALRRLILVDDASDRLTKAWLNRYVAKNPDTILLHNAEILGFTRSVIVGIEHSDAPYFVLLNSDTIVSSGWMVGLWRGLAIDETHAMTGPLSNLAYFQSIGPTDDAGLRPNRRMIDKRAAFIRANGLTTYPKVPFLSGFCLMIRRDHFDAVGGLDAESYPRGYFEVQDLAMRMIDCNLYPCLVDDVYVHHSQSRSIEAEQRDSLISEGFRQICMRHGAIRVLTAEEVCRHLPEVGRQQRALDAFFRIQEPQPHRMGGPTVRAAPAFCWLVAPLEEMISPSTEVCLFVAHAPYGQLADFTAVYLQDLRRSGFCVVVCIAVNDISASVDGGWSDNADAVLLRENSGYDFGAWADVLSPYSPSKSLILLS
jgi:tetratricopeptide (TPR) repeat protein